MSTANEIAVVVDWGARVRVYRRVTFERQARGQTVSHRLSAVSWWWWTGPVEWSSSNVKETSDLVAGDTWPHCWTWQYRCKKWQTMSAAATYMEVTSEVLERQCDECRLFSSVSHVADGDKYITWRRRMQPLDAHCAGTCTRTSWITMPAYLQIGKMANEDSNHADTKRPEGGCSTSHQAVIWI